MSAIESVPFAYEAGGQKYRGAFVSRGAEPSYGRSGADLSGILVASALLKTAAAGTPTRIKVPLLIPQGTQDQVSPMDVIASVVAELDAAGNAFRLELYGQSHHAFDNPAVGTDPKARLFYSPTDAALSRRAIAEFIRENVQPVA